MKYVLSSLALATFLTGCASPSGGPRAHKANFEKVVYQYDEAARTISIGDQKERVLAKLASSQVSLPWKYKKPPKSYRKNGVNVEIHYPRSGWVADGLVSDDEYTPYIFNNNYLVGVGWALPRL